MIQGKKIRNDMGKIYLKQKGKSTHMIPGQDSTVPVILKSSMCWFVNNPTTSYELWDVLTGML